MDPRHNTPQCATSESAPKRRGVGATVGIWLGRLAILPFVWLLVDYAWRTDDLTGRLAGAFGAVALVGCLVITASRERVREVGGLIFGLGLYGGFTSIGLSMVFDSGAAIAESQRNPGGKAPDLNDTGDSVVLGLFFLALVNVPLAFAVGGTLIDRWKTKSAQRAGETT